MKIKSIVGEIELTGKSDEWKVSVTQEIVEECIEHIYLEFEAESATTLDPVIFKWSMPQIDMQSRWHPCSHFDRRIPADWAQPIESSLTTSAPVMQLRNQTNTNRLLFAVSDAMRVVKIKTGVCEENNHISCAIELFSVPEAPLENVTVILRLDARQDFYADAIADVFSWYAAMEQYTPAHVPQEAFTPIYSTWYNFHQDLFAEELEAECVLARECGISGIIIDDGWQTDDNNRGYAFCGDWELSEKRFPDMRSHVQKIHDLGMKYIMWYSVPFVGIKSKAADTFKGKFLLKMERLNTYVLDPRFPEVREYLINIYEKAVKDWGIDGLKLDFIDSFQFDGDDPALLDNYAGRDIKSLPIAVDSLLMNVMSRLKALKPDILIEFRQKYIGPAIRKYGNIFRASDCPADILSNRVSTVDLRMTSGETAVHSDMLEWNINDKSEIAALQILNILFSVPQISVKLKDVPQDHRIMLNFWLSFWKEHSNTLLKGKFKPLYPEMNYPIVSAESEFEKIIVVYGAGLCVDIVCKQGQKCFIVNASHADSLVLDLLEKPVSVEAINVFGNPVDCTEINNGLSCIPVNMSGCLVLTF